MTGWWFHYIGVLIGLLLLTRVVPFMSLVLDTVGSLFVTSHLAVLAAFYLRRKVTMKRICPKNKAVLVTGCDSGFGHQLVKRLDLQGFYVFAGCLFPDGDGAIALRAECSNVEVLRMDVTSDEEVKNIVKEVTAKLNGMDLWAIVNNAGVPCLSDVEWCSMNTYKRTLEVNLFGMIRVTQGFLPLIRACQGRVVNVNSALGRLNVPGASAYCMSKHATVSLTDCLRVEMRRWNVKVCGIEPWFYKTQMTTVDTCLAMVHKNWAGLDESVKNAYGMDYYHGYVDRLSQFLTRANRPNTMEVVECMEDAILSTDPSEVYSPRGTYDLIKLGLARIAPEPLLDAFVERDMSYHTLTPSRTKKIQPFFSN